MEKDEDRPRSGNYDVKPIKGVTRCQSKKKKIHK